MKTRARSGVRRVRWLVYLVLLWAAVFLAQAPGHAADSGTTPGGHTPVVTDTASSRAATVTTRPQSAAEGTQQPILSPVPQHSDFPMNPGAKWACDRQTVTADPVWRGQGEVAFTFHIRNEGTADLQIRAKGG